MEKQIRRKWVSLRPSVSASWDMGSRRSLLPVSPVGTNAALRIKLGNRRATSSGGGGVSAGRTQPGKGLKLMKPKENTEFSMQQSKQDPT